MRKINALLLDLPKENCNTVAPWPVFVDKRNNNTVSSPPRMLVQQQHCKGTFHIPYLTSSISCCCCDAPNPLFSVQVFIRMMGCTESKVQTGFKSSYRSIFVLWDCIPLLSPGFHTRCTAEPYQANWGDVQKWPYTSQIVYLLPQCCSADKDGCDV